jgi:hypothetical protein
MQDYRAAATVYCDRKPHLIKINVSLEYHAWTLFYTQYFSPYIAV